MKWSGRKTKRAKSAAGDFWVAAREGGATVWTVYRKGEVQGTFPSFAEVKAFVAYKEATRI